MTAGHGRPSGGELPGPAVRLDRVSKTFGDASAPVLDRVSVDVQDGEFVSLLGASGCGKSTLLNIVAGLEPASSGTVHLNGSGAGLMFQEPALYPWLTAGRNIELALQLRGVARQNVGTEACRLLELVRLGDAYGTARTSCPAACASASRSPGRWPRNDTSCSWTSRSPHWMPSLATCCTRS